MQVDQTLGRHYEKNQKRGTLYYIVHKKIWHVKIVPHKNDKCPNMSKPPTLKLLVKILVKTQNIWACIFFWYSLYYISTQHFALCTLISTPLENSMTNKGDCAE